MDKETVSRIIDLREKGMGYRAIALEMGLKRDLVRYYCKSRGLGGEIMETLKDKGVLCPPVRESHRTAGGARAQEKVLF